MTKKNKTWFQIKAISNVKAEVRIFGEIGWEVTATEFIRALDELGDSDIDLRISSVGGSVFDGMHIYNRLKMHKGQINCIIEGLAASMATIIACAADTVSMMQGWYMIHNPSGGAWGESKDHRKAAELLDNIRETMAGIYAAKTDMGVEEIKQLMDAETWFNEEQAFENKFVDSTLEIEDDLDMAATLKGFDWDNLPFSHVPEDVLAEVTKPEPKSKPAAKPQPPKRAAQPADKIGDDSMTPEEIAAEKAAAVAEAEANGRKAEMKRRTDVTAVFSGFEGHADLLASCLEDGECDEAKARTRLVEAMRTKNDATHTPTPAVVSVEDKSEKFIKGVTNALLHRAGVKPDDSANELRGLSLRDIARECAQRAGVDVQSMRPLEFIGSAFSHSSSDFPYILENVMHKKLLASYDEHESTHEAWTQRGEVSDFKINSRLKLGSFNNLDTVVEGGEYKEGTLNEEKETIQASTKGKLISLTRQMIINDDMSAFGTIATSMGQAARRTVNADAYGVLTANAAMSDTVALFHGTHNNLAASGAAITVASISAAKAAMRKQKFTAAEDAYLNLRATHLVVPVALEDVARTFVASETDPSQSNSKKPNIHRGTLEVIVDPLLDDDSATAWYLMAASSPIVEVSYLDGVDTPFLDSEQGFTIDGVRWKVRLDYAKGAIDYRGAYKNPGA